jgi:hypothetical protein
MPIKIINKKEKQKKKSVLVTTIIDGANVIAI